MLFGVPACLTSRQACQTVLITLRTDRDSAPFAPTTLPLLTDSEGVIYSALYSSHYHGSSGAPHISAPLPYDAHYSSHRQPFAWSLLLVGTKHLLARILLALSVTRLTSRQACQTVLITLRTDRDSAPFAPTTLALLTDSEGVIYSALYSSHYHGSAIRCE